MFPAAALAVVGLAASAPGSPLGPAHWPAQGPFGVFTWSAWFASAVLATTLLLASAALAVRRGRRARAVVLGRILPAALAFSLLGGASYAAAAWADRIAQRPAAALAVAAALLIAFRAFGSRPRDPDGVDA